MNGWHVGLLALLSECLGLFLGIVLLYIFKIKNKRLIGMLFGSTSGLMIAIMCFDVLPSALKAGQTSMVVIGVIMGILIGLLLENLVESLSSFLHLKWYKKSSHSFKPPHTGMILFIGVIIHNIPEGFAFGTFALTSSDTLLKLALVIALHSIPEGIAIAIPLKQSGVHLSKMLILSTFLGCAMGIGAVGGYSLSQISPSLITLMLGLAAGVILYIVLEELIPESRKIWNGRLTSVATIIGLLLGMLLVL